MNIKSYTLTKLYKAREIVGIVNACDLIIAMRLHSMIYASESGVPAIGLSYDPKVSGFVKYIGVNATLNLEDFSDEKLVSMARSITLNREEIQASLEEKVSELKAKAMENVDMAMALINRADEFEKSGDIS